MLQLLKHSLIIVCVLLTSCHYPHVNVDMRFVRPEMRASHWIGSPDPGLCCPDYGQEMVMTWHLPLHYFNDAPLYLEYFIRYGNREEERYCIRLLKRKGSFSHTLLNEDYWCRQGVLAYKIICYGRSGCLESFSHQLWIDKIQFDITDDNCEYESLL